MLISRAADSLYRVMRPISRVLQWVVACVITMMMFLTAGDVTLRQFKFPIMGTDDITAFLMVILISFGLAYCAINKGNVRVELIVERFSSRVRAVIDAVISLLGLCLCVLISWQSIVNTISVYESGATSWTMNIIVFPFASLVAFGFAWFAIVLLADLLNAIVSAMKR